MKQRILSIMLSLALVAPVFSGCSDSDDPVVDFNKNVALDSDSERVYPGRNVTVNVTDGNGGYTARSTDETVATATASATEVTITGVGYGKANIIVTDTKGVNAIVNVDVYDDLALEESYVELDPAIDSVISIVSGNGEYVLENSNPGVVTVTLEEGNKLKLTSVSSGTSAITLTDRKGLKADLSVLVFYDVTFEAPEAYVLQGGTGKITIATGNGGYTLEYDDTNFTADVDEDGVISITAGPDLAADQVITVTDRTGRTGSVTLQIVDQTTLDLMDDTPRVEFQGRRKEVGTEGIDFYNDVTAYPNYHRFGWREGHNYKMFEVRIPTTQDLTVLGVKTGAQVKYDFDNYFDGGGYVSTWQNVDADTCEVVKYENGRVWIKFVYTRSGRVQNGLVCMDI